MYKISKSHQVSFADFNQPLGFQLNPNNRWVKQASLIPWADIEKKYAKLFPSSTGTVAKPLRMALGSLLIQKQYGFSDVELMEMIRENPYFQYFIGLSEYQDKAPVVSSLLVAFRKRLTDDILVDINEMIVKYNTPEEEKKDDDTDNDNKGTLILDATCVPQNIAYPQDVNLLNDSRKNLESVIDKACEDNHLTKPRMSRRKARKDYLNFSKTKKRTEKKTRKALKRQLGYIRRDLGFINKMKDEGIEFSKDQLKCIEAVDKVFKQQEYMYKNTIHRVKDRIVSISQDYLRPIVRGKAKTPVEFGAKIDISVDEKGICRLEKQSFDPYNEGDTLIVAVEHFYKRTGHYPERISVDPIYRNRKNRMYCKDKGIRISGPALGRPSQMSKEQKKQAYQDNVDRIEVERYISLGKRCYGLGLLRTKTILTTQNSIVLSLLTMNVCLLMRRFFYQFFISIFMKLQQRIESAFLKNFGGFYFYAPIK